MPYQLRINGSDLQKRAALALSFEFDALRAELDDLRTKYALVLAKLDLDAGVTDTNYAAVGGLTAARFTRV
jgi:hypothetical protein